MIPRLIISAQQDQRYLQKRQLVSMATDGELFLLYTQIYARRSARDQP